MRIHSYYSRNGIDLIEKYIESLTNDEQVDAYDVLKQLEEGNIDKINTKVWEGKIKEVYFYKHNRIFYVVVDDSNIYLLYACRKQKNKTEKKDCKVILTRARELSKEIGKRIL